MTEILHIDGLEVAHSVPEGSEVRDLPLVLVHGTATDYRIWRNWLDALPQHGWEAYALSLRAHGGSYSVDNETYCRSLRVDDYVDDVETLVRHIDRPCVIVGHSMGGLIAQRLAVKFGSKFDLRALILLTPVAPGELGPYYAEPLPTDVPFYYSATSVVSESPSVLNDFLTGKGVSIDPNLIKCPVLVASAENDEATVPRDDSVAKYLSADYYFFPGIDHEVLTSKGWESVFNVSLEWLADLESNRAYSDPVF
ncbi:alpha/beta fold hydrolase [Corticibacterium sp. UT-5YL-CI-8]|nr:alpha/beta fold hydrolase [Tianweitania sp. UT-5YL-CI-8]